jgi:TonB family protein
MIMSVALGAARAQTVEHPLQVGGQVKPPIAIQTADPQIPKSELPPDEALRFVVGLVVDQQGFPQRVAIIRGMGDKLDRYALECVQQYRFIPATMNGQPVAVVLHIVINIDPF